MNLLRQLAKDVQLMLRRPARLQFAALCFRLHGSTLQILLVTSRDTGRWVIPKGWPIKGKRAHEVAATEAFEEAGVKGKCQRAPVGFYHYRKRMEHGLSIACRVQIHPLEVTQLCRKFPEKGQRRLVWYDYQEAAMRVEEPSLRDQILAFGHRRDATAA